MQTRIGLLEINNTLHRFLLTAGAGHVDTQLTETIVQHMTMCIYQTRQQGFALAINDGQGIIGRQCIGFGKYPVYGIASKL